jgi:hypothetical protein
MEVSRISTRRFAALPRDATLSLYQICASWRLLTVLGASLYTVCEDPLRLDPLRML